MAQIYAVLAPQGVQVIGPLGYAGLGSTPRITMSEGIALATLLGGLTSAFGLWLLATGHQREAYAIGIAASITGAFVGAAKLLGD